MTKIGSGRQNFGHPLGLSDQVACNLIGEPSPVVSHRIAWTPQGGYSMGDYRLGKKLRGNKADNLKTSYIPSFKRNVGRSLVKMNFPPLYYTARAYFNQYNVNFGTGNTPFYVL